MSSKSWPNIGRSEAQRILREAIACGCQGGAVPCKVGTAYIDPFSIAPGMPSTKVSQRCACPCHSERRLRSFAEWLSGNSKPEVTS